MHFFLRCSTLHRWRFAPSFASSWVLVKQALFSFSLFWKSYPRCEEIFAGFTESKLSFKSEQRRFPIEFRPVTSRSEHDDRQATWSLRCFACHNQFSLHSISSADEQRLRCFADTISQCISEARRSFEKIERTAVRLFSNDIDPPFFTFDNTDEFVEGGGRPWIALLTIQCLFCARSARVKNEREKKENDVNLGETVGFDRNEEEEPRRLVLLQSSSTEKKEKKILNQTTSCWIDCLANRKKGSRYTTTIDPLASHLCLWRPQSTNNNETRRRLIRWNPCHCLFSF